MVSPTSPGISQLLEAEKKADEITGRAGSEAERVVSDARGRAEQILAGGGPGARENHEAERTRQEAEAEKTRIAHEAELRIGEIRKLAEAKRAEAVKRLVRALFGRS